MYNTLLIATPARLGIIIQRTRGFSWRRRAKDEGGLLPPLLPTKKYNYNITAVAVEKPSGFILVPERLRAPGFYCYRYVWLA